MTRRLLSARPATAALGVAGCVTLLSGCMYLSPAQTTVSYDPANGTIATVGPLQLSDVLIVSAAKGQSGAMLGMVSNNSSSPVRLTILPKGGTDQSVTIPAQTAVRLDGKTSGDSKATIKPVTLKSVKVAPGHKLTVNFSTTTAGNTPVNVPVLLDSNTYGSASPAHPTYSAPSTQKSEPNG